MTHDKHVPSHQRLDAYRVAMDLFRGVEQVAATIPRGYGDMRDQMRRAAAAVVRNIAEGAARRHSGDKSSRFLIARGEAAECEATLEMAQIVGVIDTADAVRLRRLAARAMALISGLIRYQHRLAAQNE